MAYRIAVIRGDGIGPEVTDEAVKVLKAVGEKYGKEFEFTYCLAGGCAIDETGCCLPEETVEICNASDAVLLGAVGGPKWDSVEPSNRPEAALLGLRSHLGLYANLRPAKVFRALADASPLKKSIIEDGFDILIVRELTGGIYFGKKETRVTDGIVEAYDVEIYSEPEIERIGRTAFEMAERRNGRIVSVDKANVLESSRLWRKTISRLSEEYTSVKVENMYVDNAAMQLVRNPKGFDVIVTGNMFGDILSDEASQLTGSIGMLPSASLGGNNFGMYEPVHGSAPDIAGMDIANPLAAILSAAMMLKYTFGLCQESEAIEKAVDAFLEKGFRTSDIYTEGCKKTGTSETGDIIAAEILGRK